MLTKVTKLSPIIYLLIGLFLGFLASKVTMAEKVKDPSEGTAPIRIVEITIDPSQQDELFEQMRNFAEEWRYAIRIAPLQVDEKFVDQFGETFVIQMWRVDMKLFGTYPSDPGELKIAFYYTNPAIPVPGMFFDTEIRDMKNFISDIPGATLTVTK